MYVCHACMYACMLICTHACVYVAYHPSRQVLLVRYEVHAQPPGADTRWQPHEARPQAQRSQTQQPDAPNWWKLVAAASVRTTFPTNMLKFPIFEIINMAACATLGVCFTPKFIELAETTIPSNENANAPEHTDDRLKSFRKLHQTDRSLLAKKT